MSTKDFTANVISATKIVPSDPYQDSTASGVWSIQEQFYLKKGDNWPTTGNFQPLCLLMGGRDGSTFNAIESIIVTSEGNTSDFGDLTGTRGRGAAAASSTRAVVGGGQTASGSSDQLINIDFVTMPTSGNASDFGDLLHKQAFNGGLSNSTRAIFAGGDRNTGGGATDGSNVIQFITIASTGDASDFGDLTTGTNKPAGSASPTRGLFNGGTTSLGVVNTIQFVTIGSTGNASDFGDLAQTRNGCVAFSSDTRSLTVRDNTIDFVTIASTGNASDFGDPIGSCDVNGGASTNIRGIHNVGTDDFSINATTIATTGNSVDWGNIITKREQDQAAGAAHGGLQ